MVSEKHAEPPHFVVFYEPIKLPEICPERTGLSNHPQNASPYHLVHDVHVAVERSTLSLESCQPAPACTKVSLCGTALSATSSANSPHFSPNAQSDRSACRSSSPWNHPLSTAMGSLDKSSTPFLCPFQIFLNEHASQDFANHRLGQFISELDEFGDLVVGQILAAESIISASVADLTGLENDIGLDPLAPFSSPEASRPLRPPNLGMFIENIFNLARIDVKAARARGSCPSCGPRSGRIHRHPSGDVAGMEPGPGRVRMPRGYWLSRLACSSNPS